MPITTSSPLLPRPPLPAALLVRLSCACAMLTVGVPAAAAACGTTATTPGNRNCSTPAERQVIRKIIEGAWEVTACDVRHPIGWRTRREGADGPIVIVPNPKSFLAELNFQASVQVSQRPATAEDRERRAWLEKWEPPDGAGTSPDDFDGWVRERKAATAESWTRLIPPRGAASPSAATAPDSAATSDAPNAADAVVEAAATSSSIPDDSMHFRYMGTVYQGLGEDRDEYEARAVIRRDAEQGKWRVAHTITEFGGMYSPPDSPMHLTSYACSASDRMSIDAFSSVCTAVWESMTLAPSQPGLCLEQDDNIVN